MHDHTRQQLELFDKEFVKHIDDHTEPVFIDAVGSVGPIRRFIQQALKSQAQMIRDKVLINKLNGIEGCGGCNAKVEIQKMKLDELINSFE